jgi:hypothetical protein
LEFSEAAEPVVSSPAVVLAEAVVVPYPVAAKMSESNENDLPKKRSQRRKP